MMRTMSVILAGTFLILVGGRLAAQGDGSPRQKYGPWQFNKEKNYHYREYQFKAKADDKNYQHQYCIYFKNDAKVNNKWVYFYNPRTETYWARYPTVNNDTYKAQAQKQQEAWSILPAKVRQKNIYDIDQKAWPAPKNDVCPPIPDAMDNTPLMPPPADLP